LTAADLSNTFYIASVNGINTPLPVDLISFTASIKGRGVALQWATAAETVNDHFDVQRSANGKDWSRLETVEGSGNTSKDQFYASFDPAPYPGTSYYRILQVDLDGKQNISPVVSVHVDLQKAISIYPNPVSYSLTVQLAAGGKYDISLLDQSGQTLKTIHQAGSSPEINVSDLVNGIYFLRIANANHIEMREVVVRR
jgi:hypothetical protein